MFVVQPPIYGADQEGSLFDGESASGWNVDQLDSCIQLLLVDNDNDGEAAARVAVPGVTSAYLYMGMWASTFTAHTEDVNLLSINTLHAGSPKYWYSIDREDSHRFESLMESYFPDEARQCSEFLRHKRNLLSPSILRKQGIRVYTTVQYPGDAMITFPGCYHFGFNLGFNVAESTNFAVPEWIALGRESKVCMCHPHSVRLNMERFEEVYEWYLEDQESGAKLTYTEWAKANAGRMEARPPMDEESLMAVGDGVHKQPSHDSTDVTTTASPNLTVHIPLYDPTAHDPLSDAAVVHGITFRPWKEKGSNVVLCARHGGAGERMVFEWKRAVYGAEERYKGDAHVLCLLESEDVDIDLQTDAVTSTKVEFSKVGTSSIWFEGAVVVVVDGHVRVHFANTKREDDVWVELDSGDIMLDGGAVTEQDMKARSPKKSSKGGEQKGPSGASPPLSKRHKSEEPPPVPQILTAPIALPAPVVSRSGRTVKKTHAKSDHVYYNAHAVIAAAAAVKSAAGAAGGGGGSLKKKRKEVDPADRRKLRTRCGGCKGCKAAPSIVRCVAWPVWATVGCEACMGKSKKRHGCQYMVPGEKEGQLTAPEPVALVKRVAAVRVAREVGVRGGGRGGGLGVKVISEREAEEVREVREKSEMELEMEVNSAMGSGSPMQMLGLGEGTSFGEVSYEVEKEMEEHARSMKKKQMELASALEVKAEQVRAIVEEAAEDTLIGL